MSQTREQKGTAVDEIVAMLDGTPVVYLTNYQGLDVGQATDLRDRFRESGVQFKVVKNTLLKRAMERLGGFDDVFDHLDGPTAVAFATEPAAPAKVMQKFNTDNKSEIPALKAAFIDGAVYQADALDVLASLKSKGELVADIVALLQAPMANIVGGLQAQGSNLVGAVKTLAEQES